MLWIIGSLLLLVAVVLITGMFLSAPGYKGPKADNFDGKQFLNPSGALPQGFLTTMKWLVLRDQGSWKKLEDVKHGPKPPESTDSMRITFINHSSFLIQIGGINILTDPVYSQRTSPFKLLGPKRMRPPGIRFEDLPRIDYVLISHNHYDHLDKPTVKQLNNRFQPMFVTPLGVDKFMQSHGIERVVSLDWWQEMPLNMKLSVVSVPAQHFSGRGMFDRNKTLWCGYVIKRADGNIYFAGDTGYDQSIFKEIYDSFRPIRISLIPIGAYKPIWFMSPVHISPAEAVQVHHDVGSEQSIAIHFGTFPLGDDGQQEPVEDLQKVLQEQNISSKEFMTLQEGEGCLIK